MLVWFFFFEGEDGIRDDLVTGVQTCALPISESRLWLTRRAKPVWSSRSEMGSRYPHSSGERSDLTDRVVRVNRVSKVVKGGRKFSFSALIVVGDMNGRFGAGIGNAQNVTEAIRT